MRRWADSAARARAWSRPARARGELRGTGLRFDLLRRGRPPSTAQLILHAHLRVAIAVHVNVPRSVAIRERTVHERTSVSRHLPARLATLRTAVRELLVTSSRPWPAGVTVPPAALTVARALTPASPTAHPSRGTVVLRTHTGLMSRRLHLSVHRLRVERVVAHAAIRTVMAGMRAHTAHLHEHSLLASQPAYTPAFRAPAADAARPRAPAPRRSERWLHERRIIRLERLRNVHVRTPPLRDTRPEHPAARAAEPPDTPPAPMRLYPAPRQPPAPSAPRATHTFAPSPQPLAPALRAAAPAPPPVEHTERSLRESMTKIVQHTVRHEVERVLRPDTQLSRRLREGIQAEMYDDIVFERERLGER
jgi:hypothetical protein